jgi:hypothetical protein
MIAGRNLPAPAALLARLVLGWVLALQPMLAGFGAADSLAAEHLILCRGAPSATGDAPAPTAAGHAGCCLAACLGSAAAPPPLRADLPTPGNGFSAVGSAPTQSEGEVRNAGLFPQHARAPPHLSA